MVGYQSGANQVLTLGLLITHISALTFRDTELSSWWDVSLDNNNKANSTIDYKFSRITEPIHPILIQQVEQWSHLKKYDTTETWL